MSYRHRRRSYRPSQRSYSGGWERARQHIEEGKALSVRLGGADQDVKGFLFTLPDHRLAAVLDAYEGQHGKEARDYAETVLPNWKSGRVKMSGMVATRLFDLLPRLMQPQERLTLTERLWVTFGPASNTRFRIGLNVEPAEIGRVVEQHVMSTVQEHRIPENIRTQFTWLSGGDAVAKESLLNHIRRLERLLAVEAAKQGSAVLLAHMRTQDGQRTFTSNATQTLSVGKHRIELLLDRTVQGIQQEDPRVVPAAPRVERKSGSGLVWFIIAAIVLAFLLLKK